MPDHEIGRIALAVVSELFAQLKARDIGRGHQLDLVAGRLKHGSDEPFVFPGQPTEENRHRVALGRCERPFNWTMEVRAFAVPVAAFEPPPFLLDPLLNLPLNVLPRLE